MTDHLTSGRNSLLLRVAWVLLTFLALSVGIVSLRYLLPVVPFPGVPGNWSLHKHWVMVHAASASVAIILGPWQFLRSKGSRKRPWHRWSGRVYLLAVLTGGISSIPIALNAQTGRVAQAGFTVLGCVWIATGVMAYLTIRNGHVPAHRRWMVRNYALTSAAISLRMMIPLAALAGVDFNHAYPMIAWLCWVFNLVCAEVYLHGTPSPRPKPELRMENLADERFGA